MDTEPGFYSLGGLPIFISNPIIGIPEYQYPSYSNPRPNSEMLASRYMKWNDDFQNVPCCGGTNGKIQNGQVNTQQQIITKPIMMQDRTVKPAGFYGSNTNSGKQTILESILGLSTGSPSNASIGSNTYSDIAGGSSFNPGSSNYSPPDYPPSNPIGVNPGTGNGTPVVNTCFQSLPGGFKQPIPCPPTGGNV